MCSHCPNTTTRVLQVLVNAVHPGFVATELFRQFGALYGSWVDVIVQYATAKVALTPEQGALTTLYAATSPVVEQERITGQFFVPFGRVGTRNWRAYDRDMHEKLWDFSVRTVQAHLPDWFTSELV